MRLFVLALAVLVSFARFADADVAALNEEGWASAEAAVKSAVAADKNAVTEVRRLSWLHLPAFGLTRSDNTAQLAVVAGGKVHLSDKHSEKCVAEILKAERMLERRAFTAADVVFVLHAFGEAPATIKTAIDQQTTGRGTIAGHDPTLTWSGSGAKTSASLVVWANRPTTRRGAERTPMLHLYKATMKISPTYSMTWSVESVDVPDTLAH